ncbi:ribonuclease G [Bryocella elongata]|uniref:Ribonuclease G n=1 Tax=Bryocella elongata TaxID=863522 RepID=A0A1H6AYW1_9BACT|nr:Rne/Rng family ribonuclease [Bryocella elongata]SEG53781.1 ribonuclease G [Bryocella elongata]
MSKEIYISSTPHETRLAIVEKDELTEIYYERENEYTLAGSIYNGRVTRVLPGMQSAFVDIGLERDAFLYITDFMEEAGESADFEAGGGEAQAGGGGRRGGRDRDRGRGKGRGDQPRGEQGGERPRGEEVRAEAPRDESDDIEDIDSTPVEASGESADAEGAADGSAEGGRRWRGRRGRRRGRSGRTDQPGAEQAGSSQQGAEASPSTPRADFDDAEESTADFAAPDEPIEELEASTDGRPHRDGRDRRGRRDRGDRGEDRKGANRGAREGRDSRDDRPRESQSFDAAPAVEPLILPGESLSKYRGGDAAERNEAAAPAPVAPRIARPSSEIDLTAVGWDGGFVLPGETLSRRSRNDAAPAPQQGQSETSSEGRGHRDGSERRRDRDGRRGRPERNATPSIDPSIAVQPAVTSQHEPEATVLPLSDNAPEYIVESTEVRLEAEAQHLEVEEQRLEVEEHLEIVDPVIEPVTDLAPTEAAEVEPVALEAAAEVHEQVLEAEETVLEETSHEFEETTHEYEPGENAAASFRVDPAGQREFRQSGPAEDTTPEETHQEVVEEVAAAPVEHVEPTAPAHEFTTLQPTGDLVSEVPETPAIAAEVENPSAPIEHERAVQEVHLSEVEAPVVPSSTQPAPTTFAPGDGELEEELLDDEDVDYLPLSASAADDDMEEETLENAADLGSMIREMSIDQITRPEEPALDDDDEDEDDFDIDEEEIANDEAYAAAHESADEFSGSDVSESEEDEYATSSNFEGLDEGSESAQGGEEREGASADSESAPRRDGDRRDKRFRRGGRGGGRGRETSGGGSNNGGGGNRRRHSVQATDLPAISDLLKPGQEVLVQIAKEPIAKKGARITSHIALPGRFLVFMPTVNHVGVSRKIESDSERRRLKEILLSEKGDQSGGFIVRTAASGASEEELRSDLRFLLNLWKDIKGRSDTSKSPALIYHDLNLVERILRDQVTDNFSAIWVDTEQEYERVLRFLQRFQPALLRRVKLYTKDTPLFEQFGITEEINKALRSKVWLKSGGSIVINQTEALVAIDINTGKYVGKTARLEDTIVKTNLDAIPEIVRQIRLRDLGGIIIIDFIDMDERKNRNKVMAALEEELKSDRAPSKVLQFNDFGLVAITRKRVKQSLERTLSTTCTICAGTGMTKAPITVCNEIYIELRKMHRHIEKGDIMLRVHPDVVKQLKSGGGKWLQEMEDLSRKTILVKSDPSLHPEQFDIH